LTDKDGKQYLLDKHGKRQETVLNEFGEQCIVSEAGFLVPISHLSARADPKNVSFNHQIYTSETGEKFILDSNGERLFVKTDANGNHYYENKLG